MHQVSRKCLNTILFIDCEYFHMNTELLLFHPSSLSCHAHRTLQCCPKHCSYLGGCASNFGSVTLNLSKYLLLLFLFYNMDCWLSQKVVYNGDHLSAAAANSNYCRIIPKSLEHLRWVGSLSLGFNICWQEHFFSSLVASTLWSLRIF